LSGWGTRILEVPGLIELSVMASLDNTTVEIQINDILISSGVPKKQTFKVMVIKLATTFPGLLDANSGAKKFEMADIRFNAIQTFEGGCGSMNHAVVEVD
jgi:hypothetical protein